jgi:hypothetical protein
MTTDYKLISMQTSIVRLCHFTYRKRQNKKTSVTLRTLRTATVLKETWHMNPFLKGLSLSLQHKLQKEILS